MKDKQIRNTKLPLVLAIAGIASLANPVIAADMQKQTPTEQISSAGDTARSAKEMYAMIKKPSTLIEVLKNIKLALDQHLLLREDFYTEENLKLFFGGENVAWRKINDPKLQWGDVIDFGSLVEPLILKNMTLEGISITFLRNVKEDGKTEMRLNLLLRRSNLVGFESIENIFGKGWAPSRDSWRISHGETYIAPTRPHGNERIEYAVNEGDIQSLVDMKFNHDASLSFADFFEVK